MYVVLEWGGLQQHISLGYTIFNANYSISINSLSTDK